VGVYDHFLYLPRQSRRFYCFLAFRNSSEPGSGSPAPKSLQVASNHVAMVLRQLDAHIALRLSMASCVGGFTARNHQNRRHVSSNKIDRLPGDLPSGIDEVGVHNVQRAPRRKQRVDVGHHAILPDESTAVEVHIARLSEHLARIPDSPRDAQIISRKSAQVRHHAVLPEKGVGRLIAGEVRQSADLAPVVDVRAAEASEEIVGVPDHATEAPEVDYGRLVAIVPRGA